MKSDFRSLNLESLLLPILIALCCPACPPAWSKSPDMLIFITDDHDQKDLTPYGSPDLKTPNLERLAQAGMAFTHAFVASPSCAPSRAALLTGLMPARNGAERNHSRPLSYIKKLPAYLQELGYEVAAFGKVAHYRQASIYGFDHHGADRWMAEDNIQLAVDFLSNRKSEKPLCLLVGTHEPHVPWPENDGYDPNGLEIPPHHLDTPETRRFRAMYYSAVSEADSKFGLLYDLALTRLGKDTMVVFTSDHGAQWPFGKWNLYDSGIRVPFLISWPGKIAPQTRSNALISWIDLLPTLIEAAGGRPPGDIDGQSFFKVLLGETKEHRDRIFTTHSGDGDWNVYPIRSIRDARWKYILNLRPEFRHNTHINLAKPQDGLGYWSSWLEKAAHDPQAAVTVAHYHKRPAEEFYDLLSDPYEQKNLAMDPNHQARLKSFRSELTTWMKEQGDQQKVFGNPNLLSEPIADSPR